MTMRRRVNGWRHKYRDNGFYYHSSLFFITIFFMEEFEFSFTEIFGCLSGPF